MGQAQTIRISCEDCPRGPACDDCLVAFFVDAPEADADVRSLEPMAAAGEGGDTVAADRLELPADLARALASVRAGGLRPVVIDTRPRIARQAS